MRAAVSGRLPAIQLEISELVHPERLLSPAAVVQTTRKTVRRRTEVGQKRACYIIELADWLSSDEQHPTISTNRFTRAIFLTLLGCNVIVWAADVLFLFQIYAAGLMLLFSRNRFIGSC